MIKLKKISFSVTMYVSNIKASETNIFNLDNSNMKDRSKALLKKVYFLGRPFFLVFSQVPQITGLVRLSGPMLGPNPGQTC
jgi:hypothetical protein